MTRDYRQLPIEELLQEALYSQLESLSLIHALKERLDRPERLNGAKPGVPAIPVPFVPPQPPDRNVPPFVPEGYYVICKRCAYRWLPIQVRRPEACLPARRHGGIRSDIDG